MSELTRLGDEKYVLLTTFRRSGAAVPTPVWIARDGDALVLYSARDAGKVKRIRAGADVEVTACDVRGVKPRGETVRGSARILDEAGSSRARSLIARKYGLAGRIAMLVSRLRGGASHTVGIAITMAD